MRDSIVIKSAYIPFVVSAYIAHKAYKTDEKYNAYAPVGSIFIGLPSLALGGIATFILNKMSYKIPYQPYVTPASLFIGIAGLAVYHHYTMEY